MNVPGPDRERGSASALTGPASSCVSVETLKMRADFLRAAKARRAPCPAFLLQARHRDDSALIRVGYTCSKKIGNAVTRNRAKRRLRAMAREVMAQHGRPGWDYVLVGRPGATVSHGFAEMVADLTRALGKLHGGRA
ncbi:ribonuclease P protein component [Roseibaca sp. Y0-43]|uniref:ribonuclease P protein component n=1 Tax=Roseibaca sp. Y0-43 TaxID=2816854 RepID=UPI001D0C1FAD|nr:ribonuclease P protein component [Roseibaca sp. Y0-43]MCC1482486.1 ribonuclease P protein component [Roseibaca sp. Y0-43]